MWCYCLLYRHFYYYCLLLHYFRQGGFFRVYAMLFFLFSLQRYVFGGEKWKAVYEGMCTGSVIFLGFSGLEGFVPPNVVGHDE